MGISDLLSFPKESLQGETNNYVSQHAAIHSQEVSHSLLDLSDRLVALYSRIEMILGDGPEQKAWESFAAGFTEFHLYVPRYRLRDVIPEYF